MNIGTPLKILAIEDVPADHLLVDRHLRRNGLAVASRRIASNEELDEALHESWDLVLSDYNVPGMDFRISLQRIRASKPDLPLILVSGSVGEETAVELLRLGVTDFVLKDKLARLPGAILRACDEAAERAARRAAEEALHESEVRYRSLFENSMDGVLLTMPEGGILAANPAAHQMLGYSEEELRRIGRKGIVDTNDPRLAVALAERDRTGGFQGELLLVRKGGQRFAAEVSFQVFNDEMGRQMISMIIRDLTERKQAEEQLRKLSLAVEQSSESIVITDLDANIEYVNDAFVRNSGYSREEVLGKNSRILQSGQTPPENYATLWGALARGETWKGEFYNRRKDGSEYVEFAVVTPIRQTDGRTSHYVAIKEDVTEKKRAAAEINRLAYYDQITCLPNRTLLMDRLGMALAIAQRMQHIGALILLNLDRFKNLNDAHGRSLGDQLLTALGNRLSRVLRDGDTLARVGGDEFAILLQDFGEHRELATRQAMIVAEKIQTEMRAPFVLETGDEVTLTSSLGITLCPESDSESPQEVLRRADTALHRAKRNGGNQTAFFDYTMDVLARERFAIERELRRAIPAGELRLYLQPQVDCAGGLVGAEALVRWQHPKRGLLPPGVFIGIAEESDLIVDLGAWVLSEACRLLAREIVTPGPFRLSVNLSPRQFRQAGFVPWLKELLVASGADPTHLTLEVTEGLVIDNISAVVAKMSELAALGIHFSVDDFGTGYSSLTYLKRMPIHELKIDKSFVQDAPFDPNDAALVETIISVSKHLQLQVVAEGVETEAHAEFLNAQGGVIHQGYLYGRPEPAQDWIARWRKDAEAAS